LKDHQQIYWRSYKAGQRICGFLSALLKTANKFDSGFRRHPTNFILPSADHQQICWQCSERFETGAKGIYQQPSADHHSMFFPALEDYQQICQQSSQGSPSNSKAKFTLTKHKQHPKTSQPHIHQHINLSSQLLSSQDPSSDIYQN